MVKITRTTVKSFINKNRGNLFISLQSHFDGMVDGCVDSKDKGFQKAQTTNEHLDNTLGIDGAWFVGSSRDYFEAFQNETLTGIEVYNCCGRFILAIKMKKELFRFNEVKADSVNDFLTKYYKPERFTGRGEEYAKAVIESANEDIKLNGYTIISHHSSITGKCVAYFGE